MIRVKYDLGLQSYALNWLLEGRRINRMGSFQPLQSKRDWYISNKKRIQKWNKHTMGTE